MAVVNEYASVITEDKKSGILSPVGHSNRELAYFSGYGAEVLTMRQLVTVGATDSNGSVYRVFNDITLQAFVKSIKIANTAITGGTSFDVGFYGPDFNLTAGFDNVLASGLDLSTAHSYQNALDGAQDLSLLQRTEPIYTLVNQTFDVSKPWLAVDLCITADVIGTGGGTILVDVELVRIAG